MQPGRSTGPGFVCCSAPGGWRQQAPVESEQDASGSYPQSQRLPSNGWSNPLHQTGPPTNGMRSHSGDSWESSAHHSLNGRPLPPTKPAQHGYQSQLAHLDDVGHWDQPMSFRGVQAPQPVPAADLYPWDLLQQHQPQHPLFEQSPPTAHHHQHMHLPAQHDSHHQQPPQQQQQQPTGAGPASSDPVVGRPQSIGRSARAPPPGMPLRQHPDWPSAYQQASPTAPGPQPLQAPPGLSVQGQAHPSPFPQASGGWPEAHLDAASSSSSQQSGTHFPPPPKAPPGWQAPGTRPGPPMQPQVTVAAAAEKACTCQAHMHAQAVRQVLHVSALACLRAAMTAAQYASTDRDDAQSDASLASVLLRWDRRPWWHSQMTCLCRQPSQRPCRPGCISSLHMSSHVLMLATLQQGLSSSCRKLSHDIKHKTSSCHRVL